MFRIGRRTIKNVGLTAMGIWFAVSQLQGMNNLNFRLNAENQAITGAVRSGNPLASLKRVAASFGSCDARVRTGGFEVFNTNTNDAVCTINGSRRGGYQWQFHLNRDNCLVSGDNERLHVGRSLETVFVKRNNTVNEGNNANFNNGSRNVYKVIERPSLYQGFDGPCGYYSGLNVFRSKGNLQQGRQYYDANINGWERLVGVNPQAGLYGDDIEKLLKRLLRGVDKSNVSIASFDVDASNHEVDHQVITLDGKPFRDKIKAFRQGTSQYIVISTKKEHRNSIWDKKNLRCMNLNWDDRYNRKACLGKHWLVIKLSWKNRNRAMACPAKIEVFDSGLIRDNRFAARIHWYYYLFVCSDIVRVNGPAIRENDVVNFNDLVAPRMMQQPQMMMQQPNQQRMMNQPRMMNQTMNQQPQQMMMNQPRRNNQPRMNQQPQQMMMNQSRMMNQTMNQQPQQMMMNQPRRNNQPRMNQQSQQMMQQPNQQRMMNQPRMMNQGMNQQPQQMMQQPNQQRMMNQPRMMNQGMNQQSQQMMQQPNQQRMMNQGMNQQPRQMMRRN